LVHKYLNPLILLMCSNEQISAITKGYLIYAPRHQSVEKRNFMARSGSSWGQFFMNWRAKGEVRLLKGTWFKTMCTL
jgi:hypothetical protein